MLQQQEATVTISPRKAAIIAATVVGVLLGLIGVIGLTTDVTVTASGDTMVCGSALSGDPKAAALEEAGRNIARTMIGSATTDSGSGFAACESALGTRQAWMWTLVGLAAAALFAALIVAGNAPASNEASPGT